MAHTVKDIAAALGAEAFGAVDLLVLRPAEPAAAGPDDLALAMTPAYAGVLAQTRAQAAIVWPGADWQSFGLKAAIVVPRARLAMAFLTRAFATYPIAAGIHASAVVQSTLPKDTHVGAFTLIASDVEIGAGCYIDSHVSIASGARIGADCLIHPGVRIGANVRIGAGCIVQPNAVIGADGFSFVTAGPSNEERAFLGMGKSPLTPPADAVRHRIHSLGSVVIGDDVDIGANSTIDAGTIRPTRIGRGTKIDNLVQVGHNVIIGDHCVLCAQAAVAGSTVLGNRVVMGGKSGIKDNVTIGDDVVLGGAAIVLGNIAAGHFVMGYPAMDMPDYRATQKALRKIRD